MLKTQGICEGSLHNNFFVNNFDVYMPHPTLNILVFTGKCDFVPSLNCTKFKIILIYLHNFYISTVVDHIIAI